jgi:hypothetical protein
MKMNIRRDGKTQRSKAAEGSTLDVRFVPEHALFPTHPQGARLDVAPGTLRISFLDKVLDKMH